METWPHKCVGQYWNLTFHFWKIHCKFADQSVGPSCWCHLAAVFHELRNIRLTKIVPFSRCKQLGQPGRCSHARQNLVTIYRRFCYVLRYRWVSETLMQKFFVYTLVGLRPKSCLRACRGSTRLCPEIMVYFLTERRVFWAKNVNTQIYIRKMPPFFDKPFYGRNTTFGPKFILDLISFLEKNVVHIKRSCFKIKKDCIKGTPPSPQEDVICKYATNSSRNALIL